ncbi:MAG: hypothetical protein H6667_06020 [Ardenticatenaceae bacterium]|nr:hypothetical protein [Ardenticatenaceae bacterium]MCB9443748.1 hypothetical protein [Ardenticatenaceae bacterium]
MMNKQTYQSMEQHITLLGWLYIVTNILLILIAGFVLMVMVGAGAVSGDVEAVRIMPVIATAVGGFLTALALPGILTGIGLLKRKPWARIAAAVLGIINLTNFPLGTAVGVYTLWILLQSEAADHFLTAKLA